MFFAQTCCEQHISNIVRAVRKLLGKSQTEMANSIGLTQSKYSRVENNISDLSALEWYRFCQYHGIPYSCMTEGYLLRSMINLHNNKNEFFSFFATPKRYFGNYISIRYIYPLLAYIHAKAGIKPLRDIFRSLNVDMDSIIFRDYTFNEAFMNNLFNNILISELVTPNELRDIKTMIGKAFTHPSLANTPSTAKLLSKKVNTFINIERSFFTPLEIKHIDEKDGTCLLEIKPTEMNGATNSTTLNEFIYNYGHEYIKKVAEINFPQANISYNNNKNQLKCTYKIAMS